MSEIERKSKIINIRKNDIINAAEKIIFEKGFDLATMDNIAKEAEFSKRTIYKYFISKEQLYFEIMIRGYKLLNIGIEKILIDNSNLNAIEKLKKIGLYIFEFSNHYPNYFKIIMDYQNNEKDFNESYKNKSKDECYLFGEDLFNYIKSLVEEGVKYNLFDDNIDVINTSIFIWSSSIGLFDVMTKKKNYIKHYHNKDTSELISEGFDFIFKSIIKKVK